MQRQTLPPQALLIRRMEGLVFSTLGELRAGADWDALGERVLERRAAEHPARRAGRRVLGIPLMQARTWRRRLGRPCSPPPSTYTIQAKVVGRPTDRQLLVKMANQAIRKGPR